MENPNKDIATAKPLPFESKEETVKIIYRDGVETGMAKMNGTLKIFALGNPVNYSNLEEALTKHI